MPDAVSSAPSLPSPSENAKKPETTGPHWITLLPRGFVGLWPLMLIPAVGLLLCLPTVPFMSPKRAAAWMMFWARSWARALLWCFGVKVWVIGQSHLAGAGARVVASNHRSHLDAPVLATALGIPLVVLYKASLRWVPLVGQALRMSGSIAINRSDRASARRRLPGFARCIEAGQSVLIFPEGHRTNGPKPAPFKGGAVSVARTQECSILPVTVMGTDVAFPPGSFLVRPADVLVWIHPPIVVDPAATEDATTRALMASVSSVFVAGAVPPAALTGATRVL